MLTGEKKFREYLACYGSDVESWPLEIRAWGRLVKDDPEFASLIAQEQKFEALLDERMFATAHDSLSERIIAASHSVKRRSGFSSQLTELLAYARPAALAAMLVLGFAIGFNTFLTPQRTETASSIQYYGDDEATPL